MRRTGFAGILGILVLFSFCVFAWGAWGGEVERMFEESLRSNDLETNRVILQRIIDLDPDSAYGHFSKGWFFAQDGNYKSAIAEYRLALKIRPQFGEARHNLATAYFYLGMWPDSIREYREVLRQYPEWSDTYLNLGSAHFMAKQTLDSVWAWEKAVDLNPSLFLAHYYLGLAYDQLDRLVVARRHYLHFLESEPGEPEYTSYIETAKKRQAEILVEEGRKKS